MTDPDRVTALFRDFFATLYTSTVSDDGTTMEAFLNEAQIPRLTEQQMTELEKPLTAEEIAEAITKFPQFKSPGSNGLPIELFFTCFEFLVPKLLRLFNHIFEDSHLPASMREAMIVLIPKPGKDPKLPESYCPISLLQVDVKILAKILATHLNTVILSRIHEDQSGFMPGRNTSFNLRRRMFINLQTPHENVGSRMVVVLDIGFRLGRLPLSVGLLGKIRIRT